MITGKTRTGFEFSIEDDWFDDMELMDDLVEADKGNTLSVISACKRLLGSEQKSKLYEHCRDEKGKVRAQVLTNEMSDIVNASKEAKKS